MYLGAKLGWEEDEELFGRVPVGFGPEGPAIFDHHFSLKRQQLRHQKQKRLNAGERLQSGSM